MTPQDARKVVKRLAAVEGYLELALPAQALEQLDRVVDAGPFEGIAQLFRGEALTAVHRFQEAIPAFSRAAELFPAPFNMRALLGLSRCYREQGEEELANRTAAQAAPPDVPPGSALQLVIVPIFQVEQAAGRGVGGGNDRSPKPPKKG
jgi:tetratricopeptide (TPR) repeat protein